MVTLSATASQHAADGRYREPYILLSAIAASCLEGAPINADVVLNRDALTGHDEMHLFARSSSLTTYDNAGASHVPRTVGFAVSFS